MRADLYIHTVASDGCWPPERLISAVQGFAIELFAVADQDTKSVTSAPRRGHDLPLPELARPPRPADHLAVTATGDSPDAHWACRPWTPPTCGWANRERDLC
jgi:hypothetical protein